MKNLKDSPNQPLRIQDAILAVVEYFHTFQYPPDFAEIHCFLPIKITKADLKKELHVLIAQQKLFTKNNRYSLDISFFSVYTKRKEYSSILLSQAPSFSAVFLYIPYLLYIGYSGSVSMQNSRAGSDIDFFVITEKNTVWIVRFLLLILKRICSVLVPSWNSELWCFNLFFERDGLQIQKEKRGVYVGHEILQVKTLVDKEHVYGQLVAENRWLQQLFPNIVVPNLKSVKNSDTIFKVVINRILKQPQVWWLTKRGYSWREENGQLWLIQNDYEGEETDFHLSAHVEHSSR